MIFIITRERDKEQDPDRKELKIHIKRNHSLEEIQKHANPSEYNRRKKAKGEKKGKGEEQEQQEQEGEEAIRDRRCGGRTLQGNAVCRNNKIKVNK